jgi:formate hydrogenlyase subunit 6/NADH:ubiquinone oxidoreductase subunit I
MTSTQKEMFEKPVQNTRQKTSLFLKNYSCILERGCRLCVICRKNSMTFIKHSRAEFYMQGENDGDDGDNEEISDEIGKEVS